MTARARRTQLGFGLIEILVGLAALAVISAMARPLVEPKERPAVAEVSSGSVCATGPEAASAAGAHCPLPR